MARRLGVVVEVAGARYVVIGQARPSGWWALPTAGGPAVRLLVSADVWRVAREFAGRVAS